MPVVVFRVVCRLIKSAARHAIRHRPWHRPWRAIKRAGGRLISRPAIIGWSCAVVGAAAWTLPARLPAEVPPPPEITPPASFSGDFTPTPVYWPPEAFGELPPEIGEAALIPPLFLVPVAMPPGEVVPGQQPASVPEPASLGLLATAVAAFAIYHRRSS